MAQISELDGQQVGTAPGASVNETPQSNTQGLNSFNLSHYNGITTRFGDITPFLSMETVPRDVIKFSANHELRTPTLSAPLLSPVRMHKSYFHVPMKAIMPRTWDYIIENPKRGDDLGEVSTALPQWPIIGIVKNYIKCVQSTLAMFATTPVSDFETNWPAIFATIGFTRNLLSQGSLLAALGYPVISSYENGLGEFDSAFTKFLSVLFDGTQFASPYYVRYTFDSMTSSPRVPAWEYDSRKGALPLNGENSIAALLDLLEDGIHQNSESATGWVSRTFECYTDPDDPTAVFYYPTSVIDAADEFSTFLDGILSAIATNPSLEESLYNPCKLLGYQMACAQFFSNDSVDNVHDAKLWLQNLETMNSPLTTVTINGVYVKLDVASQAWANSHLFPADTSFVYEADMRPFYNIFCYQESLKFGDYFNSGRTRPIGIGDVTIPFNAGWNGIEAIDVTKSLAKQRFLNAINRLGSSIAQYTKGIFGVATDQIEPQPQFLARSTSYIGNPETVNTADDQGNRTSQLQSVDGKYEFTGRFNDFGYLYGFVSFDIIPCYSRNVDRAVLHRDRFEFFNPMLQNIGDQSINMVEINPRCPSSVFAYAQRFSEYKQGVNRCMGAFAVSPLNGVSNGFSDWLYQADLPWIPINPYFLRHHRTEFDRFVSGIDGVGFSDYVHFAILFNLNVVAQRAMQYTSTIL